MKTDDIARIHSSDIARLQLPEGWMDMARSLRFGADILERRVLAAARQRMRHSIDTSDELMDLPAEDTNAQPDQEWARLEREVQLHRPSQMLYQMSYENALKGLVALAGEKIKRTHDLVDLARTAKVSFSDREMGYLNWLSAMNELGRYHVRTVQKQEKYGTIWVEQFAERREVIDSVIKQAWMQMDGVPHLANLAEAGSEWPKES